MQLGVLPRLLRGYDAPPPLISTGDPPQPSSLSVPFNMAIRSRVSAAIAGRRDCDELVDSIVQLEEDDFPAYFSEINGRLYSSTCSYPLPVDGHEHQVRLPCTSVYALP